MGDKNIKRFKCLHDKDFVDSETEDKRNDRDIYQKIPYVQITLKKYMALMWKSGIYSGKK